MITHGLFYTIRARSATFWNDVYLHLPTTSIGFPARVAPLGNWSKGTAKLLNEDCKRTAKALTLLSQELL